MNLRIDPQTNARKRQRGLSYTEVIISLGIGGMVMAAVMAVTVFSGRSFAAMGNYMDLDKASRNALDQMSREIRQTKSLSSFTTNKLVFVDFDTNSLTFEWTPGTGKLTRTKQGTTKVLLTQCDFLSFRISQRNPIPGVFDFYSATNNPALAKLVDVSWRCSRQIMGKKINTESVQTAKIVLRN